MTGRLTAVAAALIFRAVVVLHDRPPPPEWRWGTILHDGLETTPEGYRFKLRDITGAEPRVVDVLFRGTLPDAVCAGEDASIEGRVHGELFVASEVHGPFCTKGDPCRRYRCLPETQRPVECRGKIRFE